jgi:isoprenylcysteine carboxyl methyltransferase (ICMT) family protein YpbQ
MPVIASDTGWFVLGLLLLFVTAQRLLELVLARRNTARLMTAGAYEVGGRHYPLIMIVHVGWLVVLWWLWISGQVHLVLVPFIVYLLLQPLRFWVMRSLGPFWTTRIIVMPGTELVRHGPYRFCRHPNYLIVIMEIALLPLALGAWKVALLFSLLNAAVLSLRLIVEDAALRRQRAA